MPGPYSNLLTQIAGDANLQAFMAELAALTPAQLAALLSQDWASTEALLGVEDPPGQAAHILTTVGKIF